MNPSSTGKILHARAQARVWKPDALAMVLHHRIGPLGLAHESLDHCCDKGLPRRILVRHGVDEP